MRIARSLLRACVQDLDIWACDPSRVSATRCESTGLELLSPATDRSHESVPAAII